MVCLQLRWVPRDSSQGTMGPEEPLVLLQKFKSPWMGEFPCVSQVAAGGVGSLELPRGPEGPSHVVSGKSGIRSSGEGLIEIPLELVQGTRASFQVEVGNSGFLSISERDLGVPMEITLESQTSSHVGAWNSTSLSRCKSGVRPPVELS